MLCLVLFRNLSGKTNPADSKNLIDLGMRCLLIEDGKNLILIDNGLGNKQDDKFFGHYDLWGNATLDKSLAKYGFVKDDITDVFLTHLHLITVEVLWNGMTTEAATVLHLKRQILE